MNHCDKRALKSWEISGALLNSGDYQGNAMPPRPPSLYPLTLLARSFSVRISAFIILVIFLSYIINPLKFKHHNQDEA